MNILLQDGAVIPRRGSKNAAGYDLVSLETVVIPPGYRQAIHTGVHIEMPSNIYGNICHRSGHHTRAGILISGTVDPDFRGELLVTVNNTDVGEEFRVEQGERIAQIIFIQFWSPTLRVVKKLNDTGRGANGFGSTGV